MSGYGLTNNMTICNPQIYALKVVNADHLT